MKTLLQTPPDATRETHNYGHENVLYARRWRPWAWAVRTYIKLGMNRPPSLAPALFPAAKTQDEAMVDSGMYRGDHLLLPPFYVTIYVTRTDS